MSTKMGEQFQNEDYRIDFKTRRNQPASWAIVQNVRLQAGRLILHLPNDSTAPTALPIAEIFTMPTSTALRSITAIVHTYVVTLQMFQLKCVINSSILTPVT
jgi:hypothetical protein